MASSEEEIYSIMFTSLKHPVRRKILRMLNDKPMTFMEMVEHIGVSSSHLTYHLENLGELIFKMDNGLYKLSTFGKATISAMKGVEEAPEFESKRHMKLASKWKALFAVLLASIMLLSVMSAFQYTTLNQLTANQNSLTAENQQLLSWGIGTSKVASFLREVAQIDTAKYKITLLSNTLEYRQDFSIAEEVLKYSLANNLDASFRFRENHFSRYQLTLLEDSPIYTRIQSNDILQTAKNILESYEAYSGDAYLEDMINLLAQVNQTENIEISAGILKLKITTSERSVEFLWMHSAQGIDFSTKSLRMTFENKVLTGLTDGYFLFTIGNTNLSINQDRAVNIAKDYAKTLTWTIDNNQVTGFSTVDLPVSVELLPHPRPNSIALIPYWYIVLKLDRTYAEGINHISVGVFADNGEIGDVQMLSR